MKHCIDSFSRLATFLCYNYVFLIEMYTEVHIHVFVHYIFKASEEWLTLGQKLAGSYYILKVS